MQLRRALVNSEVIAYKGDAAVEVAGVAYDSRRVARGDLFACVPGTRHDGHTFALSAVEAGASALLVERDVDVAVTQARVAGVRRAMTLAAHEVFGRPSERLRLLGVTGTNGKTTTTHLLEAIVDAAGLASAWLGTGGARIGRVASELETSTPTSPEGPDFHRLLARMVDAGAEVAAVEVSSHALALDRVAGARFAVAGFTHLSRDHLEFHGDMETYFDAKSRLFTREHAALAVILTDDEWGLRMAGRATSEGLDVWRASAVPGAAADVRLLDARPDSDGTFVDLDTPEGRVVFSLGLAGSLNVPNAVLAAAMAMRCGLPADAVVRGCALRSVPGRFEVFGGGGAPKVIVDFAHTPLSVEAVLRAARSVAAPGGRLVAVLGAGGDRDPGKRGPMGRAAALASDLVIVTNDNPRSEDPAVIAAGVEAGAREVGTPCEVVLDRRLAIRSALERVAAGDVVVVAGKGHERGLEIAGVVHPFDDRVVVTEELARRVP